MSISTTVPGTGRAPAKTRRDVQALHDRSTRLVATLTDLTRRWDELQRRIILHLNR